MAVKEEKAKGMSGVDKAAVLLLSLGETTAAEVLKHMGPKEVQMLGMTMASLNNVAKGQVEDVVSEFLEKVEEQTGIGIGTEDYIRTTLQAALGDDKASGIIDRILAGANTKGLDTLKWMDARSVADVVRFEHPQIQSIILSYLEPDQAAEVIKLLPDKVRIDLTMRIAALETVQPEAIKELNSIMEKQFTGSGGAQAQEIGGVKKVADIMNFMDGANEALIMDSIKETDEELAQKIQDLMFVFDNLEAVDDRGIQALLREISTDTLIVALKACEEAIKEK
ncbi:MAG: flagellar motor switch protein FliG, partial [Kangiellaceae bacterium]|nr:flagellar motor switch protein FliG [Kangiellaceae bacterium]